MVNVKKVKLEGFYIKIQKEKIPRLHETTFSRLTDVRFTKGKLRSTHRLS